MGRDIGTVVFPDAALKIFLDASIQARAARRFRQNRQERSNGLNPEQIQESMEQRDSIDRQKPFGRLEQAQDALYIDTSDLTIDRVCDKVVREILKVTSKR